LVSEERHAHSELVAVIDERVEVRVVTGGLQSADRLCIIDGAVVVEKQDVYRTALITTVVVAHGADDNVWYTIAVRVAEAHHRRAEEVEVAQCD
jgi:hypothetical protein